jgi:hypothetical protein
LTDEERWLIKAIVGESLSLKETGLEMMRLLERILTVTSNISMMSDKSYYLYLALIGQIAFNVRNFIIPLCRLVL